MEALAALRRGRISGPEIPECVMVGRGLFAVAVVWAGAAMSGGVAGAQPVLTPCSGTFVLTELAGAFAYADISARGPERLYVEMGPARTSLNMKGAGISGAYTAQSAELALFTYMSNYQPPAPWLTPGSVRLDYSGFRIEWPEIRSGRDVVTALEVTVSQGQKSMRFDVGAGTDLGVTNSVVVAIDFEAMLAGRYPALRVDDDKEWRAVAAQGHPFAVTLRNRNTGEIVARAEVPQTANEALQSLLVGGVNALRDAFKSGNCS